MKIVAEIFKSDKRIISREFHQYELMGKGEVDKYKLIKQIAYKLTSGNKFTPVFNKENMLYTLTELKNISDFENAKVVYKGVTALDIPGNEKIYEKFIEHHINDKLKKSFGREYKVKYNSDILTDNILDKSGKVYELSSAKGIKLYRKFSIAPKVSAHGEVMLKCNVSHEFSSEKSICDFIMDDKEVIGLEVTNNWSNIKGRGTIESISDKAICDPCEELMGQSLIEYYINSNQGIG